MERNFETFVTLKSYQCEVFHPRSPPQILTFRQGFLPRGGPCGLRKEMWVWLACYYTSKACQLQEAGNLSEVSKMRGGGVGKPIWPFHVQFDHTRYMKAFTHPFIFSQDYDWDYFNSSCQIRKKLGMKGMGDKGRGPQRRCGPCLQDSWCVHTCRNNETGRGRTPGHCQQRPNKHMTLRFKKRNAPSGSAWGMFKKVFSLCPLTNGATEPVVGTLKSLSWAWKIGCIYKWVMPGPAQFPLQIRDRNANQSSPSTKHTSYNTHIQVANSPICQGQYDWSTLSPPYSGNIIKQLPNRSWILKS